MPDLASHAAEVSRPAPIDAAHQALLPIRRSGPRPPDEVPRTGYRWAPRLLKACLLTPLLLLLFAPLLLVAIAMMTVSAAVDALGHPAEMAKRALLVPALALFFVLLSGMAAPAVLAVRAVLHVMSTHGQGGGAFAAVVGHAGLTWGVGIGALLYGAGSLASITSLWRKRLQVMNYPSAKARSVAAGFAELRGIARTAPEAIARTRMETTGPALDWTSRIPADAIVFHATEKVGDQMQGATCRVWRRFYLEDETGRILVDPRGIKVWSGADTLNVLGQPQRLLHLPESRLNAGDRVFVLGPVLINRDAEAGAAGPDSERLVVYGATDERRARGTDVASFRESIPLLAARRFFFLSATSERAGLLAIEKSLVDHTALALTLIVSALVLLTT